MHIRLTVEGIRCARACYADAVICYSHFAGPCPQQYNSIRRIMGSGQLLISIKENHAKIEASDFAQKSINNQREICLTSGQKDTLQIGGITLIIETISDWPTHR